MNKYFFKCNHNLLIMNIRCTNGYSRGRIYVENDNDFIAFDLDEALYFEHGQEIAEMVSISLDPDIALEMQEAYAQIRGVIVLNGTYEKVQDNIPPEEFNTGHEQHYKYIEKIVDHANEKTADFYHRFPIDISIPKERIHQSENVRIQIAAFDYELPDHHTVKLSATIHITGLEEYVKETPVEEASDPEKIEQVEEEITSEPEIHEEATINKAEEQATQQVEDVEVEENQPDTETFDEDEVEDPSIDENEQKEIDISLQKTEQEEETEQVQHVQFLTDLFADREEEMQTTLTLYISQESDTIESIAKRFDIPTLRLIKDNDLSGEKVTTGQLLYIPR